ncbi:MAG: hypothetical protein WBF33_39700 [Candidatus Nitrosopolaris sp.]
MQFTKWLKISSKITRVYGSAKIAPAYVTPDIGSGGLNYYGANGSVIRGNNLHDLYFGFYSSGVGHMIIENNQVYHNPIAVETIVSSVPV